MNEHVRTIWKLVKTEVRMEDLKVGDLFSMSRNPEREDDPVHDDDVFRCTQDGKPQEGREEGFAECFGHKLIVDPNFGGVEEPESED